MAELPDVNYFEIRIIEEQVESVSYISSDFAVLGQDGDRREF